MGIDNDSPRTYIAIHESAGGWEPGEGWYVVEEGKEDDEYIAFCGPRLALSSLEDAERIARLLTASEL